MNETEMAVREPTDSAESWRRRFERVMGHEPTLPYIEAAGFPVWETNDKEHKFKMIEYSQWLMANIPEEDFVITWQRDVRQAFKKTNGSYNFNNINTMIIFFTRDTDLVMFKLSAL